MQASPYKPRLITLLLLVLTLVFTGCTSTSNNLAASVDPSQAPPLPDLTMPVYLYGEQHSVEGVLNKELELWKNYYHKQNLRYLFIEYPHYTAQYLNLWMQATDDVILDQLFADFAGTAGDSPLVKDFYKTIKSDCPQTIFIGTDVGHQYDTTGARYLKMLEDQNLQGSEDYILTQKVIDQGKTFYSKDDAVYRENMMTENFMQQYRLLHIKNKPEDLIGLMGIYGAAHTGLEALDFSGKVDCMANQLKNKYKVNLTSEDLSIYAKIQEPLSIETTQLAGKTYQVSYFGQVDVTGFKDYTIFKYYRIEEAYDDFKDLPKAKDYLPCNQYPMVVEGGQVLKLEASKTDGSTEIFYYRTDGEMHNGQEVSRGFKVE